MVNSHDEQHGYISAKLEANENDHKAILTILEDIKHSIGQLPCGEMEAVKLKQKEIETNQKWMNSKVVRIGWITLTLLWLLSMTAGFVKINKMSTDIHNFVNGKNKVEVRK